MFVPVCYTCNDKRQCACSALSLRVPRLRPVGGSAAATVVQVPDINKMKFTPGYHSATSLLVIDLTFLEGRDGELVVNMLAAVDSHSNRVSSYVFKRPYSWKEVPAFNARMNQAINLGVIGMMALYSEFEPVTSRRSICRCSILLRASENTVY
jgi:hypothetical protein